MAHIANHAVEGALKATPAPVAGAADADADGTALALALAEAFPPLAPVPLIKPGNSCVELLSTTI